MKPLSARTRRAPSPRNSGKARAGDLGAGRQIEDPQRGAELPVRPRREVEGRRLAPGPDDAVGAGVAVGRRVGGKVGDGQRTLLERGLHLTQPGIERLDLVARQP